jgi:hypothetical protein
MAYSGQWVVNGNDGCHGWHKTLEKLLFLWHGNKVFGMKVCKIP